MPSSAEDSLANQLFDLSCKLGADDGTSRRWVTEFTARYTEPQRHYHTLSHIASMFACLDGKEQHNSDAMALAIFFHDWIYDPSHNDNEVQSIQAFRRFATEIGMPTNLADTVSGYIERTITHTLSDDNADDGSNTGSNFDLRLFLDADLEVLARSPESYDLYAHQIRKEYAQYEEDKYRQGRTKVLQSFLGRDRIYFSDEFSQYEKIARQNLEREIAILQAGIESSK